MSWSASEPLFPKQTASLRALKTLCWIAGGGVALVIVFATLSPLAARPHTGFPRAERFGAYLMLGAAFSAAFPRRSVWVGLAVVAAAIALELGQLVIAGRDARLSDAIIKASGGVVGTLIMSAVVELLRRGREWYAAGRSAKRGMGSSRGDAA